MAGMGPAGGGVYRRVYGDGCIPMGAYRQVYEDAEDAVEGGGLKLCRGIYFDETGCDILPIPPTGGWGMRTRIAVIGP